MIRNKKGRKCFNTTFSLICFFFFLTNLDEMRSQWQGRMHVVKNDEENEEKVQRDYPGNGKEMS